MSKLVWDADAERLYETGTNKGVLYPRADDGNYKTGVAWNGLTGVTESPSGAEPTDRGLIAKTKGTTRLLVTIMAIRFTFCMVVPLLLLSVLIRLLTIVRRQSSLAGN